MIYYRMYISTVQLNAHEYFFKFHHGMNVMIANTNSIPDLIVVYNLQSDLYENLKPLYSSHSSVLNVMFMLSPLVAGGVEFPQ